MKRTSFLILSFLFLATTFKGDRLTGWVQQTIPRPDLAVKDLQFVDSLTGFMVSSKPPIDTAFIFKTIDGGNNWSTTQFVNYYLTSFHFLDKNIGYCAGSYGSNAVVLKTTDGGVNWFNTTYVSGFIFLNDVMFANKDTGWVTSDFVISGGLWRTTNGGMNWQLQLNDSFNPSKIFFVNSNTGWVIGNVGVNLYKTTNCGVNWNLQTNFGNATYDVYFLNKDTGYVTGGSGNGLLRSTNGGNNWNVCNNLPLYPGARIFFATNNRGWVGNRPNKILVTTDGFNWGYQYSPSFSSYNVCFVDSLNGWAGYSGLVKTTDGGGPITYTGITRNGDFVPSFELGQNYPNPFNASTRIKFSVLKPSYIELKIFNISGREISRLITGQQYIPGEYDFYFDAGKYSLTSGIYFYLMRGATTDNKEIFIDTKKLMLIK